ncbi:MAG: DUF6229 family protein [Jatrophihabitantaceae bacterium]
MTAATLTRPQALIAQWRSSGEDNPAGPLFSTPFAEADLTSISASHSFGTCSECTASRTASCC